MHRRRTTAALTLALALSAAAGCGSRQSPDPENYAEAAAWAYDRAEHVLERRDYELARAMFVDVYQNYPYSQYAALAEVGVADTYFGERSWVRAIEAYRRFVRFHPTHPAVPRAQYRVAQSYLRQMPNDWFLMPPSHERDLSDARAAYDALRLFLDAFGDSEYADEARADFAEVRDRLAAYELYVAEYYAARDNPLATATRATYLIETYPGAAQTPNALFLHARAMIALGDVDAALVSLRRLRDDYAGTDLGREAARYLSEHTM